MATKTVLNDTSSGAQRRKIQRLCVDPTINGQKAQKAECRWCDIRQRQRRFREILAAAVQIVLIGGDVDAAHRRRTGSDHQRRAVAGDAARRIGNDNLKGRSIIRQGRGRRGVARRRGARDGRRASLPLVAKRRRAGCRDGEGCRPSDDHVLAGGLRRDDRCNCAAAAATAATRRSRAAETLAPARARFSTSFGIPAKGLTEVYSLEDAAPSRVCGSRRTVRSGRHIAESRLQDHDRRDGGGFGAQHARTQPHAGERG